MMGWFWAAPTQGQPSAASTSNHPRNAPPPSCPMHKANNSATPSSSTPPASCPVMSPDPSSNSSINPLNYMPSNISQSRSSSQRASLPTSRTTSSIPRGDQDSHWEYPPPQQMYNAMLRKGFEDTPEDAVESMVEVHNFLNEGAWHEIEAWEARFAGGLMEGWKACQRGEEGWEETIMSGLWRPREGTAPKLLRLMGRPNDMTPKARFHQFLAWIYPGKFADDPPFDRHDWFVQRSTPEGQKKEVRYVIDYYSAPPEPTGEPVFYLDVRPAIDGPTAACERLIRSGRDVWFRGSGVRVREERTRRKAEEALELERGKI